MSELTFYYRVLWTVPTLPVIETQHLVSHQHVLYGTTTRSTSLLESLYLRPFRISGDCASTVRQTFHESEDTYSRNYPLRPTVKITIRVEASHKSQDPGPSLDLTPQTKFKSTPPPVWCKQTSTMGHPNEKPKRPVPKSHQNSPQTARYGFMVKTAVMIFSFFYGLVGLLAIMWIMVTKRWALRKLSKAGKEELASGRCLAPVTWRLIYRHVPLPWFSLILDSNLPPFTARSRVWNLENQTHDHRFHTMRNGCVLHYVVSQALPSTHGEEGGAGLVVFLHGFPGMLGFHTATLFRTPNLG